MSLSSGLRTAEHEVIRSSTGHIYGQRSIANQPQLARHRNEKSVSVLTLAEVPGHTHRNDQLLSAAAFSTSNPARLNWRMHRELWHTACVKAAQITPVFSLHGDTSHSTVGFLDLVPANRALSDCLLINFFFAVSGQQETLQGEAVFI